ncbi:peptidase M14, carboxypeptidase A [Ramicandelaber brevisporus]|nr:peptidase M14, carboxypeptidase A [Ramicandelaber brevisporus]
MAVAKAGKSGTADAAWHTAYHRTADIKTFYKNLRKSNPTLVTIKDSIGKTVLGKDIFAVEITSPVQPPGGKYTAYFQCLIHAREWISGAVCQYFAEDMLAKYNAGDSRIRNILDKVKIAMVPIVNVDGYEYTWTTNRLWRKNRRGGYGIDLNRNFPFHWGGEGSSSDKNSEIYRGESAASEPEAQAIVKYFDSQKRLIGGIDLHSYSELLLRPYGYTADPNPDEAKFVALGNQMVSEIAKSRGTQYKSVQASTGLYFTSGTVRDWMYRREPNGSGGTGAYGFTMELAPSEEDPDNYGFVLPPSQILPVCKEVIPGLYTFIEYTMANRI